ncbi:VapC toxin family PIN domain ribonuclease [Candidatus Williamhamiltonella defendens]|uniref:VapC toxin family PIN domain ribonuclease n=1 Tax=Candidatus Williamhamiltonella defendens TaxID=138072 RepID=A0A2D3T779_9ENTR|nr:type II toxin-antitoxin system VapC family toxin [Candidatus Hamiltonella defensa]ATW29693.1 VapC toxin family PIN domain ribonuclease [Candidatus Hamiltonella defensa]ATW31672.1 VapC toxin family PIN domain ribonuclease [Candidatus Hamiltonella defensa]
MEGITLTPVILDTHTFVWLLEGNKRIGKTSRSLIQKAAKSDQLFLSAISPWEIAMLVSKGRLAFDRDVCEWLKTALSLPGISLEPLSLEISVASTRLPGKIHLDPADRIITATARHLKAILVTEDSVLLDYSKLGHVKCQRAGI